MTQGSTSWVPTSAPSYLAKRAVLGLVGAVSAVLPATLMYGFTVDDALISARYATHIARGAGYRFNAAGPVTDGVTPLGFPYLLAPFADEGPLFALAAAKVIGLLAWACAGAVLAIACVEGPRGENGRAPRGPTWSALLLLLASLPVAAWSVSGMETGLVLALATLAVSLPELGAARIGALLAGISAALRPELLPWALAITTAKAPRLGTRSIGRMALGIAPFGVVVITRLLVFGRPVPLSVLAKPSSADLGFKYALACFLLTGSAAILAPRALFRLSGWGKGLAIAVAAHFVAVTLAGGDWMPMARLFVPVLPTVVLLAAHLATVAAPWSTALRTVAALALEVFQASRVLPSARHVDEDRRALIEELRGPLARAKVVAALDIGWLGAATDATLVDLAGLTDPSIAVLPGGHTSKALPGRLLDARNVDTIVLLVRDGEPVAVPWTDTFFARIVELRLAARSGIGEEFSVVATSTIPHLHYVVLSRLAVSARP